MCRRHLLLLAVLLTFLVLPRHGLSLKKHSSGSKSTKKHSHKGAGSAEKKVVVDTWQLTYISEAVPTLDSSQSAQTPHDTAGNICKMLNAVFKNPAGGSFATNNSNVIVLTGTSDDVRAAKVLLSSSIDVPLPQVRVRVWSVQLNELKNHAGDKIERMYKIEQGLMATRMLAAAIKQDFNTWVEELPLDRCVNLNRVCAYPFLNYNRWARSYSALKLCLVPHDAINGFRYSLERGEGTPAINNVLEEMARVPDSDLHCLYDDFLVALGRKPGALHEPFLRYTNKIHEHSVEYDFNLLATTSDDWCHMHSDLTGYDDVAESARDHIYDTNSLLDGLAQAWTDDFSDLVFEPLTRWSEDITGSGKKQDRGFDSSISSRIAVTSAQPATLTSKMAEIRSYTVPPAPLTAANIGSLLGLPGAANAAQTLISLLNTPQTVNYEQLSPGVSVAIIPTVLPTGNEARIHINVVSTVQGNDPADQKAVDAVQNLTASTDVHVSDFDLFELATLNGQNTALGDVAWQIPVLDEIPLIGPMFRGPRRRDTKVHKALILVSVGILPEAGDMLGAHLPLSIPVKNPADKPAPTSDKSGG